jgi:GH15 family glucan-1,4-alpha-glucosidase
VADAAAAVSSQRIEDYALIGDLHTAALVSHEGSIDWLCLPRFDSAACFSALLGDESHGRWQLSPAGEVRKATRRYREGTLVLETAFETDEGAARVIDCMLVRTSTPVVVRVVEGLRGTVKMRTRLVVRFDYGATVPWVERAVEGLTVMAGPNALYLRTPVETRGEDFTTVAEFSVREGERVPFTLAWHSSHEPGPLAIDPLWALEATEAWWSDWSGRSRYRGRWPEQVLRSLIVLKALTYHPTGAIVAAPTTSLPERIGGERNWDYRYCWLRDASLTLEALMLGGYADEARAFAGWLLRATAGHPSQASIMYGIAGERMLHEQQLPWLPGYEKSSPVRIGNAASEQFQLDIYGEVMDAGHIGREISGRLDPARWQRERTTLDFLESAWREPDDGIWEVRGPRRHFTHSKVMAWVAFDRAAQAVERFGAEGPVDKWRKIRAEIHDEVCDKAYDAGRRTFTQYYGSKELDAAVLQIPLVGFLPPSDERVIGTVEAVQRELVHGGFVYRYSADARGSVDGLKGGEGAFLPCSFWLVNNLAMLGRTEEAEELFERLLASANDLGLLSEEYDPEGERLVGNFPQAFTHLALVRTAANLSGEELPRLPDPAHLGAPSPPTGRRPA